MNEPEIEIHTNTNTKQDKKNLSQQIFHKAMFHDRPRSQSFSNGSDMEEPTGHASVTNCEEIENSSSSWSEVQPRKRPRNSPENNNANAQKQTKLSHYWLSNPVPTSNSFEALNLDKTTEREPEIPDKSLKPPPIFVDGVENITPLKQLLDEFAKTEYELKVLRNNSVKILMKTHEVYKKVEEQLDLKGTDYYTYKPKQERSFKVVLKNMHPSTNVEDIKAALLELGHETVNIWNMKQRITKTPLHMFIVELSPQQNNKEIYNVKSLLHCRIIFEPPRPVKDIPQCANCQNYGHTKAYCHRKPRCIKCAGDHQSAGCPRKDRSEPVKCVLCGENHTANYKGCRVYKELQKQKYPSLRAKVTDARSTNTEKLNHSKPEQPRNETSYADALKKQSHPEDDPNPQAFTEDPNDMKQLINMFKQIMTQLCTMTNLLTNLMSVMCKNSTSSN